MQNYLHHRVVSSVINNIRVQNLPPTTRPQLEHSTMQTEFPRPGPRRVDWTFSWSSCRVPSGLSLHQLSPLPESPQPESPRQKGSPRKGPWAYPCPWSQTGVQRSPLGSFSSPLQAIHCCYLCSWRWATTPENFPWRKTNLLDEYLVTSFILSQGNENYMTCKNVLV